MYAASLLASASALIAASATLPLAQGHNFWIARCETSDLVNGIASNSVEFYEAYEFTDANWFNAGRVCEKNKYRPWHRACLEGTFKGGSSYGYVRLTWHLKSNTLDDLPDNVFFGTLTTGGESSECCKKNYKANQWHEQGFGRNKVCNAMFYCGEDNMCVTDKSVLA